MQDRSLDQTLDILFITATIIFFVGALAFYKVRGKISQLKINFLLPIALLLAPAAISLSLFPVVYSTLNISHQDIFSAPFWKLELATGVFALRASSYTLTFNLIYTLIRLFKRKHKLGKNRELRGLNVDEVANFTVDRQPDETKMWIHADIATISFLQFLFYLTALGTLWYCNINSNHSIFVSMLNWSLLYIIDDWVIISCYSDHYREFIKNFHTYKILAFDVALLILVPFAAFTTSCDWITISLTLIMIGAAGCIGIFTRRSYYLHSEVQYKIKHQ